MKGLLSIQRTWGGNSSTGQSFGDKVALGRIPGYQNVIKFGRNSDIDISSAPEDIWEGGGTYTGQPVAFTPERVTISSTSALDTSDGTGSRTVRIFGLQTASSTEYTSEDITLSGLTGVLSTNSYYRINRMYVLTAGSADINQGVLSIAPETTTANIFAKIPATVGQTQIAAYTIPNNKKGLIKRIRVDLTRISGAAGSATVILRVREVGGVYRGFAVFEVQTGGALSVEYLTGLVLPEGSDFKFEVQTVSDNNSVIEAAAELYLIDDV